MNNNIRNYKIITKSNLINDFFLPPDIPEDIKSNYKLTVVLDLDGTLIHSNSSLCWIISFLSNKTKRIIPSTNMYKNQLLYKIQEQDIDDI